MVELRKIMKAFLIIIPLLSIFSCTTSKSETQPDGIIQEHPVDREISTPTPPPIPVLTEGGANFNPGSISAEEFETAMWEIQILIEKINRVIREKNYDEWLTYLSDDFVRTINSPEYLDRLSQTSRLLRLQKIVLKTPQDYFFKVVVAARTNINVDVHLDDIEFLSHTRVKAYAVVKNHRLRLFEFVKDDGKTWKVSLSG
jgi:hypothetical protein